MVQSRKASFEEFAEAVRSSVEDHAKRKGYRSDDERHGDVRDLVNAMGLGRAHAVAEIIYKLKEFLSTPKRVLLEKVAGWAFILWREMPED